MRWFSFVSAFLFVVTTALGGTSELCERCHPKEAKVYLHPVYEKGRCEACHERGESSFDGSWRGQNQVFGAFEDEEVDWKLEGRVRRGVVLVEVLPDWLGGTLVVEAGQFKEKVEPKEFEKAEEVSLEGEIERVYVCDKLEGVSVSYKVCVESSVPARVRVKCEGGVEVVDESLSSFHEVWLEGLKRKEYACEVEGFLGFAEEEVSLKKEFKVWPKVKVREVGEEEAEEVSVKVVRVEGSVFLRIEADGVLDYKVGLLRKEDSFSESLNASSVQEHAALVPKEEAGGRMCMKCHEDYTAGPSHPVDVEYTPGRKVKPFTDLPLPNGKVECVSCHYPHTSDLPGLLRRTGRDLCLSCHEARYFGIFR